MIYINRKKCNKRELNCMLNYGGLFRNDPKILIMKWPTLIYIQVTNEKKYVYLLLKLSYHVIDYSYRYLNSFRNDD